MTALVPISELAIMRQHLAEMKTNGMLVENTDYGVVPGTKGKPSLFKPGAEKLLQAYNLSAVLEVSDKTMDFASSFFYFSYRCTVLDVEGRLIAQAEGSANSHETKYRYRKVYGNKASEEDIQSAVKVERGPYGPVYHIINPDPADVINTLQKMAQKRAMVAAVLIAVGASQYFTQDVEDFSHLIVEGEVVDERPAHKPKNSEPPPPAEAPAPKLPTTAAELLPYAKRLFGEDDGLDALKAAAEARGIASLKTAAPHDVHLVVQELLEMYAAGNEPAPAE